MTQDTEISSSIRKLFIKFVLFQAVLLVAAVALSAAFTAYFKLRLGTQLSASSRDAVISGDSRRAIVDLTSSVKGDFYGMAWQPSGATGGFVIPAGREFPAFSCARAAVSLYFDGEKAYKAGEMIFYYSRWSPVFWGFGVWLVLFALSVPVALLERRRLVRDYNLLLELKIKESFSALAAQVAHDIRSPLAALGAASKGLALPAEQRTLIDGAIGRMQGIADDLLQRYRAPGAAAKARVETCALAGLAEQVLAEKRLQYKDRPGVKIEFSDTAPSAKAAVDPKELQRIISNLVNNAVEAFETGGLVSVSLAARGEELVLEIKDDGKGIPPELLAKLGRKGETHGKAGGTGLGLHHARVCAEGWGGGLQISSEPGKGTAVTLTLPAAARPAPGLRAVLLDDDALVHMNWRLAAKAAGAELKSYKTPQEFSAAAGALPRDIPLYIDSELGGEVRGEDVARELYDKGFTDISMATGHAPEKFAHLPWLKVTGKEPPWV